MIASVAPSRMKTARLGDDRLGPAVLDRPSLAPVDAGQRMNAALVGAAGQHTSGFFVDWQLASTKWDAP